MSSNSKDTSCPAKKTSIGGQALIEGIMMRGPEMSAMAVRNPEGEIVLEKWATTAAFKGKFFKLPIIRGIFNFIDSMRSGYKCLMRSAEIAGLEEEEPSKDGKSGGISQVGMNILMVISAVLGVLLAVALFMWLPVQLYSWGAKAVPALEGNRFLRSLCEGVLRIVIFLGYMLLMTRMKDIRRTFEYHGAEHKTIFCYEAGEELTVENIKKYKRFHPRCGTSFLFVMLILSILVFSLPIFTWENTVLRFVTKLLFMPLVMGLGYEFIRFAGRHDNIITRILSAPGLWMQRITTREPDDSMIEIAVTALKRSLPSQFPDDQAELEKLLYKKEDKSAKAGEAAEDDGIVGPQKENDNK